MKFEIGQKVFDSFRYAGYEGVVTNVADYAIWVFYTGYEGDRHVEAMYQGDGKYIDTDAFPTLYPHPYEFEAKEVSQFAKGELILHRNNEAHPWNIGKYQCKSEYPSGEHRIQSFGQFFCYAKFIIPFKNNEDKLWKRN